MVWRLAATLLLLSCAEARASDVLGARRIMDKAARGEPLTEDERRLAADVHREWKASERVPGAARGDPAVGRALEKLARQEAAVLSGEERMAIISLSRTAQEVRSRRDYDPGGGAGRAAARPPSSGWLDGIVVPVTAGGVAVVLATLAGLLHLGRRSR